MTTGTSHFESFPAAVAYYRPYLGQPAFGKDLASKKNKDDECREWVQHKLAAGEIHIGKPSLKAGERLTIHTTERRYFITDES